ncbi:hypothetical protein [Streptomyces roseolilacinus]|uniref:Secreted protein n=1 Tax=Streptomyces roseolilacinus TaxID=66904 RepID=A0A918EN07_9ACTN|nr:hypothetical protein [Streptomyces roseolilacinus]GGQ27816.1 secreted protein [Streptomyces roseolilacinus]
MAMSRACKALLLAASGLLATSLGAVTLTTGAQAVAPSTPSAESAADMPLALEGYTYPGASRILQERGITLKRGDGNITLVPCVQAWNIKIESRLDNGGYCFNATAQSGYLTLELPDAWGVWTENHPVQATLTAAGAETVVDVPANHYQPVGETGDIGLRSVLVEIRVTG